MVRASRPTSSSTRGTVTRRCKSLGSMASTSWRNTSTGRNALPTTKYSATTVPANTSGEMRNSWRRNAAMESSRSVSGVATYTTERASPRTTALPHSRTRAWSTTADQTRALLVATG